MLLLHVPLFAIFLVRIAVYLAFQYFDIERT